MLPREKLLIHGPESLKLEELVSVVLNTGVRELDVFKLAHHVTPLLVSNQPTTTLKQQLKEIPGLGEAKIAQILAVIEIAKRIKKKEARIFIQHPQQVVKIFSFLRHRKKEYFYVHLLSARLEHIEFKLLAKGKQSYVLITPKDVIKTALKYNADRIILVHNHPSGNPTPSEHDIKTTQAIDALANLLGIKLLDHIIITKEDYYSFRANNML